MLATDMWHLKAFCL